MRCVPDDDFDKIIFFCHDQSCGGILVPKRPLQKSCSVDFIGPPFSVTAMSIVKLVKVAKD